MTSSSLSPNSGARRRSSSAGCQSPFQVGSLVEFRSNEIGFSTAWFEGTVIGKQSNHRSYIVAYPSFVAGAASSCNERVFHNLLRPRPPPTPPPPAVFRLHECVEAFQYGVWWKGVVSKLPAGVDGDGLYSVCFPASREEFQFKVEDMRKRMEWADGDWLPVEDEDIGQEKCYGAGLGTGKLGQWS